jgi:sarcosine oxidase
MQVAQGYDVIVIGGAVMGSAVAYFLTSDPNFGGTVLVVEPDPTYERTATARSWGGIRQQFSTPENIRMSIFGIEFLRKAHELLAVNDEGPDLAFRENGYLFLASPAGRPQLESNTRLQRKEGAVTRLLQPQDLQAAFPWLNPTGIAAAGFGPQGEGWIDAYALLQGFRRKAESQGARYVADRVCAIHREGPRVTGVSLEKSGIVDAGVLVNAAGPQAGAVSRLAGLDLPVEPRKRMSYVFDCRSQLPPLPLTIDPSGVAFRPEGPHYLAIVSPPRERDFRCEDLEEEYDLFEEVIWPVLAHRVPAFEAIKLVRAWAGHYDYNTFDQNAVLGAHPEVTRLFFCNGFSGHGIQQSPAAGRAIAELILYREYRSLDLSRFGFERLLEDRPLQEANVV